MEGELGAGYDILLSPVATLEPGMVEMVLEAESEMAQEAVRVAMTLEPSYDMGNDKCLFALDKSSRDLVGVLLFSFKNVLETKVKLLYVEPSSRNQGVARLLWQRMMELSPATARSVSMEVRASNAAGQAVARKLAGLPSVVTYRMQRRAA